VPKIRNIKPEFWTDEKIVELSPWARLLFIGLWNFADDNGILENKPKQLKMRIFPCDDVDVGALLDEIASQQIIIPYEIEGKRYFWVPNFTKHQYIAKDKKTSTFPLPPQEILDIPRHSQKFQLGSGSGSGSGSRGKSSDEDLPCPPAGDGSPAVESRKAKSDPPANKNNGHDPDFEAWWQEYPERRKTGKPKVYQKWRALKKGKKLLPLDQMLAILRAQKQSHDWTKDGGDYIPGPYPYLNQFKFLDESIMATKAAPRADPNCPVCRGEGWEHYEENGREFSRRCKCLKEPG
jgi:hypothetical protein